LIRFSFYYLATGFEQCLFGLKKFDFTEDYGKPFFVNDVLVFCDHDSTSLLKKPFVAPVVIKLPKKSVVKKNLYLA
jgi:hypothetical protein